MIYSIYIYIYHVWRNNPSQVARRIRKISSEDSEYNTARDKFSTLLIDRGYSADIIKESFCKFDSTDRATLYQPKSNEQSFKKCLPLVSEFNPHLPAVPPVLNKYNYLLELDPVVRAAIPKGSIFASYKQPSSILDILVHSKFDSSSVDSDSSLNGCKSCNNCFLCKYYLIETDKFKSYHSLAEFNINHPIYCSTEGVIYLIQDLVCQRSYVGSSIDSMKTRMSNYKNHLKTNYKGCEMAQHFQEAQSDTHSLYCGGNANMRTKAFQNSYDEHLSKQINVIIIEHVDLSSAGTTKEKRALIESREGYWQTQLRTLTRYGGLNKKDERKITNKRIANKYKAPASSSSQPAEISEILSQTQPDQTQKLPSSLPNPPTNPTHIEPSSNSQPPPGVRRSSRLCNRK